MPLRRLLALAPLAFLCLRCGNPDTVVQGGISATKTQPVAIFNNIGSAESGVGYLTDSAGRRSKQLSIVAISDHPGLCDALKKQPNDYFRNPPNGFVALLLFADPVDNIGTFYIGDPNHPGNFAEVIATNGGPSGSSWQPYLATNPGGAIDLNNFDVTAGGFGRGTFDVIVGDNLGGGHEFYGRFRTHVCPGGFDSQLLP